MLINLGSQRIHYKIFEQIAEGSTAREKENIVFLHGWGCNIDHYAKIYLHLAKKSKIFALDLPGFGLSNPPAKPWATEDYARLVSDFINELDIKKPIIIGHSVGGRFAIYAIGSKLIDAKKLILINSAGIKASLAFKTHCRILVFKLFKKLAMLPFLKKPAGAYREAYLKKYSSEDYRNASGVMRTSMVKIINEDLCFLMPKIDVPALLIWGEKDNSTPLTDGKKMQKLMPNAELVVLTNCGHYSFLDDWPNFIKTLENFLSK